VQLPIAAGAWRGQQQPPAGAGGQQDAADVAGQLAAGPPWPTWHGPRLETRPPADLVFLEASLHDSGNAVIPTATATPRVIALTEARAAA
jgi:hypothetical protein